MLGKGGAELQSRVWAKMTSRAQLGGELAGGCGGGGRGGRGGTR